MNKNPISEVNTPATKKKHPVLRFVVILVVCALLGACVGFFISSLSDAADGIYADLESWLVAIIPHVQWIWLVAASAGAVLLYGAARTATFAFERGGSENEATSLRAEKLLGFGMLTSELNMIVSYGLFGVNAALATRSVWGLLGGVIIVFVVIAFYSCYTVASVKLTKRLYPEKKGHPLDFKFSKDWIASCDEAELMGIYRAAYRSFRITNMVLLAVWMVTVILSLVVNLGIYPVITISLIWLVHSISYQWYSIHDTDKSNKKQQD